MLVTEITPMKERFGLPRDNIAMPGIGTVFAFGDMERCKPEEMVQLSHQRRALGVYCKRCKQILGILHNRDSKPSPKLFDKSALELYEHLDKEHTIADSRVQEMRRICIELLDSRNLRAGNRNLVGTD
jgi:hypothetical protein